MKATLLTVWKWLKWPVLVLVFLYSVLVGFRIFALYEKEKTAADVERIHADKLEWTDINGELPPEPDQAENNATLAGVDSNQNGIRDDVERAIYLKYKDQPRLALALLQYAKSLQLYMVEDISNGDYYRAINHVSDYGASCVRAYMAKFLVVASSEEEWLNLRNKENDLIEGVKDLTINTVDRKNKYNTQPLPGILEDYRAPQRPICDLEI